ncbi:hypothetical protein C8J56DRAFT_1052085 [Mycena floridula]|nr:hypothetical protein C8J56DRAFT_1052085 [Mycena floridula]
MSRVNRHLPNSQYEDILPFMHCYYRFRWDSKQILAKILAAHVDTSRFSLGIMKFRRWMKLAGLTSARDDTWNIVDRIRVPLSELRVTYPLAGALEMKNLLFHESGIHVLRHLIRQHKANRLKRKRFWAAGVNDLVVFDQHDKWKR